MNKIYTFEKLVETLQEMIDELGRFPVGKDFQIEKWKHIKFHVGKHGGINAFRGKLGFEDKKPCLLYAS